MSNPQSIIELVFQGVDKTGAATAAALANTKAFAGSVETATQPIADFTTGALKLEASLLAAGVAITAFSVKVAGDFDTAFREISTLIDVPIQDLGEFKDAILSYAATSTQPLEEITQSIYNAISAGVDYADSIEAVALAEQLAVAGKAELSDSLIVLVSSLNAYGVGMEDAERYADALFQTVKSGQTTLPELASALSNVTGLAATAGVDFEELLAAVAAITSTGQPTAQAVTQIRGALSAILGPSKQASDLAKELGIQFDAERLKAVGLKGVLDEVATATGGNVAQMKTLFGPIEALNGVLTLTGKSADTFAANLQAMAESAGSVEQAFDIMVQSVEASSQKISNALTGLFISIGSPLLDEFGGVADAIAEIFNALGESARAEDGGLSDLVKFIESQFEGLQLTLEEVARNLPAALEVADFSGFTSGIQAVSDSIANLFSNIDLTSAEGLASAIELLGAGFEGLSRFTGGVIDSFKPLFDQITRVSGGLREINPEIFETAGNIGGFAKQANILSGAIVEMLPAIQALAAAMGVKQAAGLAGAIANVQGGLGGSSGLLRLLGNAGLLGAAAGAGLGIGKLADEVAELATGTSLSDRLSDWFTSFTDLDEKADDLTSTIKNTRGEVEKPPATVGLVDALEEVIVTAERWDPGAVIGPLEEVGEAARSVGSDIDQHSASIRDIVPVYDDVTGKLVGYTDSLTAAGGLASDFSDATAGAADSLLKMDDTAQSLTVQENIALIKGQATVMAAEFEASAKVSVAAFESIDNSVNSTGETISNLFSLFGDENISKFDKLGLSKQIEKENEHRERTFALQEKQINAQIRLMNERAKALKAGKATVSIKGDGLQPHLEAFMFEILKNIQTRVNADGLEMLLGADPVIEQL